MQVHFIDTALHKRNDGNVYNVNKYYMHLGHAHQAPSARRASAAAGYFVLVPRSPRRKGSHHRRNTTIIVYIFFFVKIETPRDFWIPGLT